MRDDPRPYLQEAYDTIMEDLRVASSPMEFVGKRFGLKWYWARPGQFTHPGIYVWNPLPTWLGGHHNVRVVPA